MKTEQGNKLATSMNLGEVTSWRLHLLLCHLSELQHDISICHFGSSYSDLIDGPFAKLLARVKRIENDYGQIRRETQLMLGLDYSSEIEPLFQSLPKNEEYLTKMQEAKASLQAVVDRHLGCEARFLKNCIQDVHQSLA